MSWHLDAATVDAYRAGRVNDAVAASLEAHVVACATCRELLRVAADPRRLDRNFAAVLDRVDSPRPLLIERLFLRLGVGDHHARLIAMTPALRAGWLGGLVVVSMLAVMANARQGATGELWFLVVAPVVPLLGVVVSFGPPLDPAHELLLSSPVGALELVLLRAAAVLATSLPLTLAAGVLSPGLDWSAAAWLVPSLALTATALALTRWVPLRVAACALGAAWLVSVALATRGVRAGQLVHDFPAFRPAGQVVFLVVALLATISVAVTRDSFDLRRVS